MTVLAIDLGGTKLSLAVLTQKGNMLYKACTALGHRKGQAVGLLVIAEINKIITTQKTNGNPVHAIGVAVPGIYRHQTGTVWAPNIGDWDDYPLLKEIQEAHPHIPVTIDSDRACYILGELWQGNAKGCKDAIYLAVGTGIGAGIVIHGEVLRGAYDIAGAIGWMALERPFADKFISCGCFEYYASGEGIARVTTALLSENTVYSGELLEKEPQKITAHDVFAAYENKDAVAIAVIAQCIELWGMAVANLVSLLNPEKIILGGGVFGPAVQLVAAIKAEALKWAQPISMRQVSLEVSKLGTDAGLYGAGWLAIEKISVAKPRKQHVP